MFPLSAAVIAALALSIRFSDRSFAFIAEDGGLSPTAATAFLLLALCQTAMLVASASAQPAVVEAGQLGSTTAVVLSIVGGYGVLFQAPSLVAVPGSGAVSSAVSGMSFLLALAVLAGRPDTGVARVVFGHTTGAMLTRSLLTSALVVPSGLGLLVVAGQNAGWYGPPVGYSVLVAGNVALVVAVALITGVRVARMEAADAVAREELRRRDLLGAILRNTPTAFSVKGLDGRYQLTSAAFERLHDLTEGQAVGRADHELHGPEQMTEIFRRDRAVHAADRPLVFEDEVTGERGTRTYVTTMFPMHDERGTTFAICSGITEITELRVAEGKFKGLLDASPEAMVCVNAEGRIVLANARALQVFRYEREELVGTSVEALVPGAHRARHIAHRREYLANPVPRPMGEGMHLTAVRKDGTEFPVEISLATVDGEGGPVVIVTVLDITQRLVQAQTDAQLAAIVEASSDAIVSKSLDGVILTWNPGAERLYGYPAAEMIGRDVTIILPADRPEEERALLGRVRRGELIRHHETQRVRRDGGTIYVSLSMAPVRDTAGSIVGASTISHDITAEVEAEQRLRIERERFEMIMTAASDPFVSMDDHGRITEFNGQAEQVFGWSRHEILGCWVIETILPPGYTGALDRVLRGRWDWLLDRPTEMFAVRRGGAQLPIELTMWRIRRGGSSTFHAFARDITARRQTELALAQARDQALEVARLKSQFLASMSHEIRTPMNGVIGLSGLLIGTDLSGTQRRYAEGISRAGTALLSVINDVLDFSKIEAGKVVPERVDFEVWRLLDEVVGLLADGPDGKNLTVVARCDSRLSGPMSGDVGKLRQVLVNLVGNAIKFTERGEVVVAAEPVPGAADDGCLPVRFVVADTGIGIEEDEQGRLFEPFTQADASTTRRFGGTGLGLAISHELVGVMGGEIKVTSRPGHGSSFSFTVPLWPAATPVAERYQGVLEGRRVLVVAAEGTERRYLCERLGAWSMAPATAENAPAALHALADAAASGHPFDLALLDADADPAGLPGAIAANPASRASKLVLLNDGVRPPGFDAAVSRPVRQSQLHDVLVDVLAGSAARTVPEVARESRPRRGHLLLVEDNDINQTVALGILDQLGYSADVALNGREAVAMARSREHLAILMDCLMPEMDGYQATAEIRRQESTGTHVPIIAMTAGALPEDRARCLAAGMDDHISKPLMPQDIATALDRWVTGDGASAGADFRREIEQRLDLLRGAGPAMDDAVLADLLRRLSAHVPRLVEAVFQALACDDAPSLRDAAHQLKGAAANLGARHLAELSDRVERAARSSDLEAAVQAVTNLRSVAARTLDAVDAIAKRSPARR